MRRDNLPAKDHQSYDMLEVGRRVLIEEAAALKRAALSLDSGFTDAVHAMVHCRGRVIVSGVGKSGHVGRKIAATLASTGTPSFFVHAAEAGHGDLGMITCDDLVVVISNSGESEEVINIASFAKRFGARVVGMTGSANSSVGQLSDIHIGCSVSREACPLGVAPTSSTAVQMALGDALAMAAVVCRGFTTEDFARTHPLGQLGRRHYLRVRDVMQSIIDVPSVSPDAKLVDAIPEMAIGRMGALLVLEGESLAGIFTDSDLRRLVARSGGSLDRHLNQPIKDVMTRKPLSVEAHKLASYALGVFEKTRVSRLVCVEDQKVVGILGWQNLLHHKIA